ncbi:MAG: hypothetical protein WBA51_16675 [Erythrobacter sp.]
MATDNKLKVSPFWLIVILLLIIAGGLVLFTDVISGSRTPEREPEPPSTEWTTAPEGGVEVDLPETAMRVVPGEETTPEEEASDEAQ